jgi:hypothetical protein
MAQSADTACVQRPVHWGEDPRCDQGLGTGALPDRAPPAVGLLAAKRGAVLMGVARSEVSGAAEPLVCLDITQPSPIGRIVIGVER